jgi:uncharacterized membrane protein YeaQ/YmgE (transglycosylase-associated protein family)
LFANVAVQGGRARDRPEFVLSQISLHVADQAANQGEGLKSMHLSDQGLLVILVVGIIAGWLAGKVVRGSGFGLVGDAAIGIVGALIGDWLLHRLGIHLGSGIIGLVIDATIGAILFLFVLRLAGASGWGGR